MAAEAAHRGAATAALHGVARGVAGDRDVGRPHDHAGCEGRAAGPLAVPAVAVEHGDGRAGAGEADRSAGAAAGEGGVHGALLPTLGTPEHHRHLGRRVRLHSWPCHLTVVAHGIAAPRACLTGMPAGSKL